MKISFLTQVVQSILILELMGSQIVDITVLNGTLYALDVNDDIRSVNRTTGATTVVNNNLSVGTPYAITAHNGDLWVMGSSGLFQVDGGNLSADTGTEIGNISFAQSETLVSFNGNLYYWKRSSDRAWFQINTTTGAITLVGQDTGITSGYSATVKDGKVFMIANNASGTDIFCFTDITGTAEQFGDFMPASQDSIAWHDGDKRMYYEDNGNLEYLDLYDPPIKSVDFSGDDYTSAIAQCVLSSSRIEVQVEKLQRNDGDAFVNISGSYEI